MVSDVVLSFSVPVVLAGTDQIPPATAVNFIPWALIGFIFNYVIRKRHFNWWAKYNCECWPNDVFLYGSSSLSPFLIVDVLSAALDTGTAVGILVVFFT
jgi:hypothetical protein